MQPLKNNILVVQQEETGANKQLASGIIITQEVTRGNKPAKIIGVGPNVDTVKIGDVVILQWDKSLAVSHDGEQAALVSEEFVEAIL